jgi:NAD(P)-dependent dehydrogenase (short-subunit alcohol dehydrogenase family)
MSKSVESSSVSKMPTSQPLLGRTALITGASRGIGHALAYEFASQGADLFLLARTVGGLEEIHDEIKDTFPERKVTLIANDLTNFSDMEALGPAIASKVDKLDIWVANAGMLSTMGPLAHGKFKEFQKVMDTNVTANYQLIRTLDPLLKNSDAGRVIFVTSGAAEKGRAYWGAYSVSKAALEQLASIYAAENEITNINVNVINPGQTRTAMWQEAFPGREPEEVPPASEIVHKFVELALPSCTQNGAYINAQD